MQALGRHLLVDLYGCDRERLDDPDYIAAELQAAAQAAGTRVLGTAFHRFSPGGVTGVLIVQESHLAVHTWPERGYAALDLCSPAAIRQTHGQPINGSSAPSARRETM